MRIGLDLDGCLYDFVAAHRHFLQQTEPERFGDEKLPDPQSWSIWEWWPLTREEWQRSFDEGVRVGAIFGGQFDYPGAIDAAHRLTYRHELHVITHRPTAGMKATADWLAWAGFPTTSVTFSKDKTTVPVDVIVEDNVDNALAVVKAGGRAILIDRPWNRRWEVDGVILEPEALEGIHRARDWPHVERLVEVIDAADLSEPWVEHIIELDGHLNGPPFPTNADEAAAFATFSARRAEAENPKDRIGITKPPLDLIPPAAEIHLAMAMGNGAEKYGAYNWREKRVRARIYLGAARRHLAAWLDGERVAADSGVHHLGHAMACCAILLDAEATGNLEDDRPTPGAASRLIAELTATP